MSFENTLNRFKLVSGLSDDEVVKWLPVLKEAREYVKGLITKEDLSEKEEIRLDKSAGVYAYYRYLSYNVENENSFSAGDVTVYYNKDKLSAAKAMWNAEMEGLTDMINGSDFTFKRVW